MDLRRSCRFHKMPISDSLDTALDPLRIALISRRYPPEIGGAEKVLSYLALALAKEGSNVVVLTSRPHGTPHFEQDGEGLSIVRLPTIAARFLGTILYMKSLKKWLALNRIDIAYVSMLKHDAFVAVAMGKKRGFPVILRPEGAGATGDVAWQGWGRFGKTIAERCRRADAFVSISEPVARELIDAGYDPKRIVSLPNGVPIPVEACAKGTIGANVRGPFSSAGSPSKKIWRR